MINKIPEIQGLRGYLALWIVANHVLGFSGFSLYELNGIFKVLKSGHLAVNIFIIISGFAIFFLLDNKREDYKTFITRRFFRIYPLFIVSFILAILLNNMRLTNLDLLPYVSAEKILSQKVAYSGYTENLLQHTILHLTMLHGVVPDNLLAKASNAFLGPAWAVSIEWQFYLVAPLIFWTIRRYPKSPPVLFITTILIIYTAKKYYPPVTHDAFLPFHGEYFFLGILSYYIFKNRVSSVPLYNHNVLFMALLTTILIFAHLLDSYRISIPLIFWLLFFTIILHSQEDGNDSIVTKITRPVFRNRACLYLGKISYSIFLIHTLIIIITQRFILQNYYMLTKMQHCILLAVITVPFSIILGHFFYLYIEQSGIQLGKMILKKHKIMTSGFTHTEQNNGYFKDRARTFEEKRLLARTASDIHATLIYGNFHYTGIVNNLSEMGMFINSKTSFPCKTVLSISIPQKAIARARVIWRTDLGGIYNYGVEFMDPTITY
jgi:peptidoglycan/LPS O-acetylase OafA/YrhL